MTPTTPDYAPMKVKRRWFRFSLPNVSLFTLPFVACGIGLAFWSLGLPLSWTADYDGKRYTQIRRAIDADPKHLLGKSFDEISRRTLLSVLIVLAMIPN